MNSPRKAALVATALVLPCAGVLLLHAYYYWPFISDDALISLRYASRLLEGHGLTWTEGRPVEGYSNLLWILLVAALGWVGLDLIHAARLLGASGMIASMLGLAYWYARKCPFRVAWVPILLALLFFALGAPIAVWTIGGLEQPLFGALIAFSVPLMFSIIESEEVRHRTLLILSSILGLLCLTRPDGPIFAVTAAVTLFVIATPSRRRRATLEAAVVLALPVVFSLGQLGFRVYYYEELLPNTALVKLSPSFVHWRGGVEYVKAGVAALMPLSGVAIACLAGLLASKRRRGHALFLVVAGTAWSGYVAAVGGDIFPAYRHMIPLIVIFAFALAEGAAAVVSRLGPSRFHHSALVALGLLLLVPYSQRQFDDKQSQRALRERWEWQGREVGLLLKAAFSRQQPLLAVTAAGCLPYWSELPALDMLGLNDYYLPRHPPRDIVRGFIGHELGDGEYVLSSKPDLIVFNVGSPPQFRSGEDLERMPEFHEKYLPVVVRLPSGEDAIVYVNRYSEKVGIGILQSASSISIPGFLFRGENAFAHLDTANRLVTRIAPGKDVVVSFASDSLSGWLIDVRMPIHRDISAGLSQVGSAVSVSLRSNDSEPADIEEVILRRPL